MKKIISTDDSYDLQRKELTDFELAGASGLPDYIINAYAQDGLLKHREKSDRTRVYPENSIEILQEIHDMKEAGMTNDEIRGLLRGDQYD